MEAKSTFERVEKVRLAILDKDLKARTFKKFPLSSDGTKIDVVRAGSGYFMPKIDNDSFVEFPYRTLLSFPPFKRQFMRVYFATRGADACINFRTGEVPGPDPQQVLDAAKTELVKNFGKEKQEVPLPLYIILVLVLLMFLKLFGVIV